MSKSIIKGPIWAWNFWTGVKDWAERKKIRRLANLAIRARR